MAHEIVKMYNAELGATGECTVDGFRQIYQYRGWALIGPAEDFAGMHLGKAVGSLEDLTTGELLQVATTAANKDFPKNTKKDKLVAAIKGAVPGGDLALVATVDDGGVERDAAGNIIDDPSADADGSGSQE